MKRVTDIESLNRIAKEWKPSLTKVLTIKGAADYINFPHEDYPKFILSTEKALRETIRWIEEGNGLRERDIKQIHQICMEGKEYLRLGDYRGSNVIVGKELFPPEPYMIFPMMMSIFPVGENQMDESEIIEWYKIFETIHPFEDGNGRVGGIVMSALSYVYQGYFLVPKREYFHFIDLILTRFIDDEESILNNPKYFDQDLDFGTRCVQYVSGKMNGIKFNTILEETGTKNQMRSLVENNDINGIKNLLYKIRKK